MTEQDSIFHIQCPKHTCTKLWNNCILKKVCQLNIQKVQQGPRSVIKKIFNQSWNGWNNNINLKHNNTIEQIMHERHEKIQRQAILSAVTAWQGFSTHVIHDI